MTANIPEPASFPLPSPNLESTVPKNAGVHLLLHFHNGQTEEELIAAAAEKNVKVYGLSGYYVGERGDKKQQRDAVILLGYANMKEENIHRAAALLAEAWT